MMLAVLRQYFAMPLLAKELSELAARRRTYVVRFLCAAVLFTAGLFIIYGRGSSGGVASLGQGQEMFNQMFRLQIAVILIVLPASCAGAFAGEKERESLSLLLLTTIPRPMIVLQKLLSRMIPMLAFVILSFPLMATAYSFGGVQTSHLYFTLLYLVLLIVLVGSLSILCSTFCRTTLEAYVASYLCLVVSSVYLYPLQAHRTTDMNIWYTLIASGMVFGPIVGVSLLLSVVFLSERAFIPPTNFLLSLFKSIDVFFQQMNIVTGGVVLVRDGDPFPDQAPISWRETAKRSLGTFRYLFRVLIVIEIPILIVSQMVRIDMVRSESHISTLLYIVWVIALVLTSIHSASVISAERSRQTLEVLLVVPMEGQEILHQKLSGVKRLFWTMMVPFTTIFVFQHWFHGQGADVRYLLCSYAGVFTMIPLVMWLGMLIGLKSRSQMRASMTLLGILAALTMAGPILIYCLDLVHIEASGLRQWSVLSPGTWVLTLERDFFQADNEETRRGILIRLGSVAFIAGLLAILVRRHVRSKADILLGRVSHAELIPRAVQNEEFGLAGLYVNCPSNHAAGSIKPARMDEEGDVTH